MAWITKKGYSTKEIASGSLKVIGNFEIQLARFLGGKFSHFHKKKTEFFFFYGGSGKVIIDNKEHKIKTGSFFRIRPKQIHTFINTKTKIPLKAVMVKVNNDYQDTYDAPQNSSQ